MCCLFENLRHKLPQTHSFRRTHTYSPTTQGQTVDQLALCVSLFVCMCICCCCVQVSVCAHLNIVLCDLVHKHTSMQLVHHTWVTAHDASNVLGNRVGLCVYVCMYVCICVCVACEHACIASYDDSCVQLVLHGTEMKGSRRRAHTHTHAQTDTHTPFARPARAGRWCLAGATHGLCV